jgi:hypothetical protein
MKSAYELAMERLSKSAPTPKLTDDQKKRLAELDSIYKAKTAEREIAFHADIRKAEASGDAEAAEQARRTLAAERQRLEAERDAKKDRIRAQS